MAIKLGGSDIAKVYLGSTEVDKIYLGATEVYSGATIPLLDTYTGAEFAHSFRLLRTAYGGNSTRARRSSDNAEQDIALVDGFLDTTSLLTFTGANNGLTPIIYDQSGNANNLTQTTAANQLEIVNTGSLITSNSLAATQGSSSTGGQAPSIAFSGMTDIWFFDVIDVADTAGTQVLFESSTNFNSNTGAFIIYITGGELLINVRASGGALANKYPISTGRQLISIRMRTGLDTNSYSDLYINGTQITLATALGAGTSVLSNQVLYLNARAGGSSLGYTGKRQESIFYPTDQSSNRVAIEANINAYYGIY
tara:strand:+ start:11409 stop:12338 length:930 start_codon:yes stop_codon:yes gene_type:complete